MTSPGAEPAATSRSPYALALGSRRAQLDPRLAAYFSSLGPDGVGVGHGVFTTFGTPRRWLRPVHLLLPAWCSPRVRLREAAGPDGATQQVALTIDAPLLGRLYSYEGTFTAEIQREAP